MGKIEIVRLPLKRGASKEHRIPDGNTALSWAQALGHKAAEWISGEWPLTWVALTRRSCRNRDVDMAVRTFRESEFRRPRLCGTSGSRSRPARSRARRGCPRGCALRRGCRRGAARRVP